MLKKRYYENIDETIYYEILDNGLPCYYLPKTNYNKAYASLSVNFGSLDQAFYLDGKIMEKPSGIAHYLEHKMFDMPYGDSMIKFDELGVNANAYTTYDRTSYLFSATSNFNEALELLLEYVNTPYFTIESVAKEQGIIIEEIKKYEDYPDEKIRKVLFNNILKKHPLLNDIAGSVSDVKKITAKDLEECYKLFYTPSNMLLFIVGNFDLAEAVKIVHQAQYNDNHQVKRREYDLSYPILKNYQEIFIDILSPKIYYGFKLDLKNKSLLEQAKINFSLSILFDLLFGNSSIIHDELIEKQLINDNFGFDISSFKDFIIAVGDAETNYPDELFEYYQNIFRKIGQLQINPDDFERIKNANIGSYIKAFNSLEAISNLFINCYFMDLDLFLITDILSSLTLDDLHNVIKLINIDEISFVKALPNK